MAGFGIYETSGGQQRHRARQQPRPRIRAERRIEKYDVEGSRFPPEECVSVGNARFRFAPCDEVLTEYSYKYVPKDFERVVTAANWRVVDRWTDTRGWFGVFALELHD